MLLAAIIVVYLLGLFILGRVTARRVYDEGYEARLWFFKIDRLAAPHNTEDAITNGLLIGALWPILTVIQIMRLLLKCLKAGFILIFLGKARR